MIKEYNMWFTRFFSPQRFINYNLSRFLRKFIRFLRYEIPELLIILGFAALFMLIWDYFF